MKDDDEETLGRLVRAARKKPTERRLVCAACAGEIELRAGRYHCTSCPAVYTALAELAAVPL